MEMDTVPKIKLGPVGAAGASVDEIPALYIPIWRIADEHRGRKVRLDGQVIEYDTQRGHLLIASEPTADRTRSPRATILVGTAVALLGQSPAVSDLSSTRGHANEGRLREERVERRYDMRLSLRTGHWVSVVGWLEGDLPSRADMPSYSSTYARPFPVMLDAIHIAARTPPPIDVLHPVDMS